MGRKPKDTSSYLRALREEHELSLSEMVKRIGYTKGYISAVETGASKPTSTFLRAYERALNLAPGSLAALHLEQNDQVVQVLNTVQEGIGRDQESVTLPDLPIPEHKGAVLEGVQAILLQAIAMVNAAAKQTPLPGAEIIVTFQSEIDPLSLYPDLSVTWRGALRQALKAGWNVTHLWRFHGDTQRRFEMITRMLSLLGYRGKYQPSMFTSHVAPGAPADVILVPGQGALWMFGSRQSRHVDSGFFFPPDSPHYAMVDSFAATMRTQTQPLLEVFPARSLDFKAFAFQIEQEEGDQLLLKEDLTFQAMPPSIRSDCIDRILNAPVQRTPQQQSHLELWCRTLLEQHSRRYLQFEEFLRRGEYQARHIVTRESIENMLATGALPADDWLRDEANSYLTRDEVNLWLRQVIALLERYPNFHLAIVEQIDYARFPVAWKVQGKHMLILESWKPRNGNSDKTENVNILVRDRAIAYSFREHFIAFWNSLPPEQTDKASIIAWLRTAVDRNQISRDQGAGVMSQEHRDN